MIPGYVILIFAGVCIVTLIAVAALMGPATVQPHVFVTVTP